jgi:hypothetical protein
MQYGITVRQYRDLYLFNYEQVAQNAPAGQISKYTKIMRSMPLFHLMRGMVLDSEGRIKCLPFKRFFNHFETEKAKIDWTTAKLEEKVDGSLINVFYHDDEWIIATRGMIPADDIFRDAFVRIFGGPEDYDRFGFERTFSYSFELVSFDNRNITLYKCEFVRLLMIRDLESLQEFHPSEADHHIYNKDWRHVTHLQQIPVKKLKEAQKYMETLRDDEEGFVVVDDNKERIKLKSETYFKMARIVSLKKEDIMEIIAKEEFLDPEYLENLPDVKELYDKFKYAIDDLVNKASQFYKIASGVKKNSQNIREKRKKFAMIVTKSPFSSIMFQLYDIDHKEEKREQVIRDLLKKTDGKKLLSLTGF